MRLREGGRGIVTSSLATLPPQRVLNGESVLVDWLRERTHAKNLRPHERPQRLPGCRGRVRRQGFRPTTLRDAHDHPFVIDNQDHKLADVLNELLARSTGTRWTIATAYFAISGYRLVKTACTLGAFRLLLGRNRRAGPTRFCAPARGGAGAAAGRPGGRTVQPGDAETGRGNWSPSCGPRRSRCASTTRDSCTRRLTCSTRTGSGRTPSRTVCGRSPRRRVEQLHRPGAGRQTRN